VIAQVMRSQVAAIKAFDGDPEQSLLVLEIKE